jgi:hypothetical protein
MRCSGSSGSGDNLVSVDYRSLLRRYIHHVGACEGVTYLDRGHRAEDGSVFSDEEWAELQALDEEGQGRRPRDRAPGGYASAMTDTQPQTPQTPDTPDTPDQPVRPDQPDPDQAPNRPDR